MYGIIGKVKKLMNFAIYDLGRAIKGHILWPKLSKYSFFCIKSTFLSKNQTKTTKKLPLGITIGLELLEKYKKMMFFCDS